MAPIHYLNQSWHIVGHFFRPRWVDKETTIWLWSHTQKNRTLNRFIPFQTKGVKGIVQVCMDTWLSLVIWYIYSFSCPLALTQCNYYRWDLHYFFISSWRGISFHMGDNGMFWIQIMYINYVYRHIFSLLVYKYTSYVLLSHADIALRCQMFK